MAGGSKGCFLGEHGSFGIDQFSFSMSDSLVRDDGDPTIVLFVSMGCNRIIVVSDSLLLRINDPVRGVTHTNKGLYLWV